jgi:hypothetical protein
MKKRGFRFLIIYSLILCFFDVSTLTPAHAATIGSGNCVQTVDSSVGVAVTENGNYCYVAFKSGTNVWYTPSNVTLIDYLVVAGGGSGGSRHGGGGGAGGLLKSTNASISNISSLSISVGTGGAAVVPSGGTNYAVGIPGNNSSLSKNAGTGTFSTLTAIGGGGGEAGGQGAQSGGSGGGSQYSVGGAATSGQGNAGGTGGSGLINSATNWWAGGGGGAGTAGGNGSTSGGGNGGTGAIWLSTFTTTIATAVGLAQTGQTLGDQVYFAGGGGGSITLTYTPGSGGLGGGGAAVTENNTATSGTANSGGGGGASGCCNGGQTGAGGSGVVLIRYVFDVTAPTITGPASATGATSSISISENTTAVHTFTASETVTWSKSGTDQSFFSISTSGVLSITARNYEAAADSDANNTYIVVVTATDGVGNVKSQTLTVTITNVNEAPTISINNFGDTHTITQAENISSLITYTATDVDAGTAFTWSLSGTDAADFSIVPSTGILTFAANPDFEAPADSDANNVYVVVVTVSDGSLADSQTLTVTITNANEGATINAPTISNTIYKGVVETITVTINVAGKVRFFVGGKRISTCKDRVTSGSYPNNSATCLWKPPVTGRQVLTATLTPTDSTFSASTSAPTVVQVRKRTTTR